MSGMEELRIGTRGSELAIKQVQMVADALVKRHPRLKVSLVTIRTAGDVRTDLPLCRVNQVAGVGDKGVFVAAIEEELASGAIDCAVHSCKDLPGAQDSRFEIAAVLPREAMNDTLVLKPGSNAAAPVLGTGSVRRSSQMGPYWSGRARAVQLRGNVPTRLRKLVESEEMDGILLARAGLNRLGFTGGEWEFEGSRLLALDLDCEAFMPALCQGAIGVETRVADSAVRELVRSVNHKPTELCIRAERAFLAALEADCSVPVAGYAELRGAEILLRVLYFPAAPKPPVRLVRSGSADAPEALGAALAQQLRAF